MASGRTRATARFPGTRIRRCRGRAPSSFSRRSPGNRDIDRLRRALAHAGRDVDGFELVGGTPGRFPDADSVADLDEALATIPAQVERGFTSICIKPSQFLDDPARHAAWCGQVVATVERYAG